MLDARDLGCTFLGGGVAGKRFEFMYAKLLDVCCDMAKLESKAACRMMEVCFAFCLSKDFFNGFPQCFDIDQFQGFRFFESSPNPGREYALGKS